MTDQMIYSPPVDGSTDQAVGSNRGKLTAIGVGVLLLALTGGYLLLGRSSTTAAPAMVPHGRSAATRSTAGTATTAVSGVTAVTGGTRLVLPTATTVRLGRDPFKPLYTAPVAAAVGTSGTPSSPNGMTTTGTTQPAPPTSAIPAGSAGSGIPAPAATSGRYPLVLTASIPSNVDLRRWRFTVDGVGTTVVTSQKFGKSGELVVLGTATDSRGRLIGALVQVGDAPPITTSFGVTNKVQ